MKPEINKQEAQTKLMLFKTLPLLFGHTYTSVKATALNKEPGSPTQPQANSLLQILCTNRCKRMLRQIWSKHFANQCSGQQTHFCLGTLSHQWRPQLSANNQAVPHSHKHSPEVNIMCKIICKTNQRQIWRKHFATQCSAQQTHFCLGTLSHKWKPQLSTYNQNVPHSHKHTREIHILCTIRCKWNQR